MENQDSSRPTLWIAATAVCLLAAIGLGIWGFSQKSDLDDANQTIDNQKAQLSGQESSAAATETKQKIYNAATVAKYAKVRRGLVGAQQRASEAQKQIDTQEAQLNAAKKQLANANTTKEKQAAELNKVQQERDLAAACAQGTITAINDFFASPNAARGAQRSMKRLVKLEPQCNDVLSNGS